MSYSTLARYCGKRGFVCSYLVPRPPTGIPRPVPSSWNGFNSNWITILSRSGFAMNPSSWRIRPKAMYANKGITPTCPATGLHTRENVAGAVQPTTGEFVSLVFN